MTRWRNGSWVCSSQVRFERGRQLDPKATAFSRLGFDADSSAHAFSSLTDYGEADSCAGIIEAVYEPHERQKDFLQMGFLHADTIVAYGNPDVFGAQFSPDFNFG